MAFRKSIILWAKDTQVTESNTEAASTVYDSAGKLVNTIYYPPDSAPKETSKTIYDYLEVDCVISESHNWSNEVTSYPISSGFLISEHTIKKNRMFSMNGIITNVNMLDINNLTLTDVGKVAGAMVSRVVGPLIGSLLGSAAHAMDSSGITKDPIKDKYEKLQKLVTDGTIVHIATILGTYEGCVMREIRINQDVTTSSVMPVTITFEQLRIIQPDGRIGFNLPKEQKNVMQKTTPTDTETMLKVLKQSGISIIGGYVL